MVKGKETKEKITNLLKKKQIRNTNDKTLDNQKTKELYLTSKPAASNMAMGFVVLKPVFKRGEIMDPRFNYVYGSAAPKLPDSPIREEQKVRRKRTVRKNVAQPGTVAFPLIRMIACILISFVLLFTIISRFSAITEMNCELSALAKEYETIKDSNRRLQAEIGSRINLEKVRTIAENELNMKMPDSYQRIPVKIPKVNYSMVNQEIKQETKTTLKSLIMAYFGQ